MHDDDDDDIIAFAALSERLRQRIDHAFNSAIAVDSQPGPPRKRRKINRTSGERSTAEPGGFIIDDEQPGGFLFEDSQPGGFIVDGPEREGFLIDEGLDTSNSEGENTLSRTDTTQIPLSYIPTALHILDIPPDDEDILSVFRTAASGWQGSHQLNLTHESVNEQYVSRKDWRTVCAVLLDTAVDSTDRSAEASAAEGPDADADEMDEEADSSDEYMASDAESEFADDAEDSDEDYQEGGFVTFKAKSKSKAVAGHATRRTSRAASSAIDEYGEDHIHVQQPRQLTARQKEECRRTFALFFPGVLDEDLDTQKIMIKDISRVFKLLKEKITAEEIVEMLEVFSTSSDKSMRLRDFERMMVAAKLV
ncbi:hypothetical protein BKA93DRAFT_830258 [Sparassis latifolia]